MFKNGFWAIYTSFGLLFYILLGVQVLLLLYCCCSYCDPQAQIGQQALYDMVFGPKNLISCVLRALALYDHC